MKTLTWLTFLPLLTAAVLLFIPGRMKGLIKFVSVVGAVWTFVIAIGITRDFIEVRRLHQEEATAYRQQIASTAHPGRSFDEVAGELVERELQGIETGLANQVRALLAAPGKTALTAEEQSALGPRGITAWERARELQVAAAAKQSEHIRFVEFVPWIGKLKINYFMGVDGLSLPLVWLTALLGVLCVVYSWTIDKGTKAYYVLFLLLETGLIGVFCALDFFLFYVFWEVVLLPMYFLIGVWGGPNRIYAAIKFFIYTLVGSVLMLLVMLVMFFQTEPNTFNVLALMQLCPDFSLNLQLVLFIGLFIGFAIKVPVFPFHTWLPDAHVEAPTAISVVLAGVLLKMGGYGFFRFSYPMLPDAAVNKGILWFIGILGVVNIIYGAFCALAQKDFKKLVAYSSISHMGYVLLGMAALSYSGVTGAVLQMFTHGLSSAMLFFIVGVIYDRAHHRNLDDFGGMSIQMPWYTGLATVGFFASLGLPALCGFISEVMTFIGAWDPQMSLINNAVPGTGIPGRWMIYVSLLGIVLTAAYILWTIQRVYYGPVQEKHKGFKDVSFREVVALAPLALLCILVGVLPQQVIITHIDQSLQAITDTVRTALSG
jgi:NADH-quinone oxidoreductase subunit M